MVVNCSFWIGWTLMATFGCFAWYEVATFCQTPLSGSAVPLCHQVSVTGPLEDAALPELPLLPLEPHAVVTATVAPTTTARTPRDPILRMSVLSS